MVPDRAQGQSVRYVRSISDYRSLSDYIERRITELNARNPDQRITPRSLSMEMQWGESYISGIINEVYRPSVRRCKALADRFGDDPNIILALAGYYEPTAESPLLDEYTQRLSNLNDESQELALMFLDFLKYREDSLK